ncbi:M48 family metallopeptidase [Nafulsella turpanensis]|uniref:M48 family metallopeptidase n=1 Tax=Nafulsella turpanensis TaxID=1265690 RepID=UPI00034A5DD5|nr:M48 family metallopeptidase [Nafulsella turpanensis]
MSPEEILYLICGLLIADFLFDQWLNYLNLRHGRSGLPEPLRGIYPEEEYHRSISYQRERQRFSLWQSSFSFVLLLVMLLSGAFGWLDGWLRLYFENPLILALAFFGVLFVASDLLSIPFQWYSTFVIEEKWGFNKTTPATFIKDKLKGYLLGMLIGGGILAVLLYLILFIGPSFWLYFWAVMALFSLGANMFYSSLILPLFNKLSPLPEGELKEAILAYSRKVNFPVENMYVIDGSKRSSKANAFFSGLGKKKKIVLFDTLIDNHSTEELVAVLAHEAGHYKKKHIVKGFVLSLLQSGLMLFLLSLLVFYAPLSAALGGSEWAMHLNLLAFGLLFSPVSLLISLFTNKMSRKHEYEADAFAAETYGAIPLQEALKKLSVRNLTNLWPHPLYVRVHYSHPPLLRRLKALEKYV